MSHRVLVAGGAGFVGSHLCDRLLADGHDVLCVDNLSTGSRENIHHLRTNPRFEFLRHDFASLRPSKNMGERGRPCSFRQEWHAVR